MTRGLRRSSARPPAPARRDLLRGIVVGLLVGGLVLALGVAGVLVGVTVAISQRLPSVDALYQEPSEATRIYAADGQLIASLYRENRNSIPLSQVPRMLQRAVIDTEDADFYHHHGFSLRGILRAGVRNVQEGGYAEGGSTITQQLARNLFLTSEKSFTRKIAEILLAIQIERRLTKDEILERYLNQVYFGEGAYGVETAAEVYFGKRAQDLTLPQCALLAGLVRAPSYYSPYEHPTRARARMAEVLQRMVEMGDITPQAKAAALAAPLHLAERRNAGLVGIRAPYFVSYILPMLVQRYGEDAVYTGGLRVYTTLDLRLQGAAQAAIQRGIDEALRQHLNVHQGALVAIDPRTGYIRAMVGGYDFRTSQFNRAWQAHRQPGSAFKPFTYTVALMRGIPPTHLLLDAPIEFTLPTGKVWAPQNYDKQWHGLVTMRYALEHSINVASVRLEQEVGPSAVVDLAHRMGISSPLQPNLSLTLGSSDVTLLEMVSAYGVFATEGIRAEPLAILKVTDRRGKVLEEHSPVRYAVLSPEVAYLMTDLLKGVIQRGTGTAANIGIPEAGKTGTADDYRNAWFIGFTPYLVTGVWVGNDDDSPMNRVVGGSVPAQIWASFMKQATAGHAPEDWPRPEGIVEETVCGTSGLLASPSCPDPRPELFIRGTEPDSYDLTRSAPSSASTSPALPTPPAGGATPAGGASAPAGVPAGPPPAEGAAAPVALLQPADGSEVSPPIVVRGKGQPGSSVHITATVGTGVLRVQVADATVVVDQAGTFTYRLDPWFKPAGARVVITAVASGGAGGGSPATVTVRLP